jgi:hypothetical protein
MSFTAELRRYWVIEHTFTCQRRVVVDRCVSIVELERVNLPPSVRSRSTSWSPWLSRSRSSRTSAAAAVPSVRLFVGFPLRVGDDRPTLAKDQPA